MEAEVEEKHQFSVKWNSYLSSYLDSSYYLKKKKLIFFSMFLTAHGTTRFFCDGVLKWDLKLSSGLSFPAVAQGEVSELLKMCMSFQ